MKLGKVVRLRLVGLRLQSGLRRLIFYLHSNAGLAFLAGFFMASIIAPLWWANSPDNFETTSPKPSNLVAPETAPSVDLPARLLIPSLEIDTTFTTSVGVDERGEMAVPSDFNQVAWYHFSPAPGAVGPAVVIGHVNSYLGPAVFDRLSSVESGALVIVETEAGRRHTFKVTAVEDFTQTDFPTRLVYGDLSYPGLRLVTCSGVFDETGDRFTHNTVVFAELVDSSLKSP